ncbi:hypothetical protein Raf01_73770 [Rugosimonospora africana]|uniref:Uncharacterized protein n=1 Tax=Rugosimonospora africana TaxID=556532 RepID=A0A8J3R0N1_9ACTN|nr:hypothetical protein Raf01_73770 [Rugosimonospora africana]
MAASPSAEDLSPQPWLDLKIGSRATAVRVVAEYEPPGVATAVATLAHGQIRGTSTIRIE